MPCFLYLIFNILFVHHIPQLIVPKYLNSKLSQTIQDRRVGMAVGIVAYLNNGFFGLGGLKQFNRGGSFGTVMADLENIYILNRV